jgi:hypothetical protein
MDKKGLTIKGDFDWSVFKVRKTEKMTHWQTKTDPINRA